MPIILHDPTDPILPSAVATPNTLHPKVPTVLEQAAALQLDEPEEIQESNPLLPPIESAYTNRDLPYGLTEKLTAIETILEDKGKIPLATLRLACKAVMQCIKANEDSLLALEPADIQLVVQGYIKSTDTATREVLEPKAKKAKAKKVKELKANPIADADEEW